MDPSSESEDIAVGTSIELPFWLAQTLCSQRRNIVTVEIPKIYKEAYRSVVQHARAYQVYYWYLAEEDWLGEMCRCIRKMRN